MAARDSVLHLGSEAISGATPQALSPGSNKGSTTAPNVDIVVYNSGSVDVVLQSVDETDDDAGYRCAAGAQTVIPYCAAGDSVWQLNSVDGTTAVAATVAYFGPPA